MEYYLEDSHVIDSHVIDDEKIGGAKIKDDKEENNSKQKEECKIKHQSGNKYNGLINKLKHHNMLACNLSNRFLSSDMIPLETHESHLSRLYISQLDNYWFMTKICFYPLSIPELYINVPKVISHCEAEINILTEMRRLLNEGYLKTVVRLIHTNTCQDITKLIGDPDKCHLTKKSSFNDILCSYSFRVKSGLALPRCSFLLLELCDMTLTAYLEKYTHTALNFDIFKSIMFHIIYTLYVITSIYPQFHHYDLHTDNIMIKFCKSYDEVNPKYYKYIVGNKEYYVPQYGIKVKIIDFEFASIPELNLISVATKDRLIMFQRPNKDILHTLFWINYTLSAVGSMNDDIMDVLKELDPFKTFANFNMAYVRSVEDKLASYEKMLSGKAFFNYTEIRKGNMICLKKV